jgi:hypothetical protein
MVVGLVLEERIAVECIVLLVNTVTLLMVVPHVITHL